MANYLQLVQEVISQARQRGVEAEAYVNVGQEAEIVVDRGKVEKLSQAGSKGLGVRVLVDGKMGYAYTSNFSPQSISRMIEEAITLSEVADGDQYRSLPAPQAIPEEDLDIYDPAIANLSAEEKVEMAKQIEQAALSYDERVLLTNRCTLLSQTGTVTLANSKGVEGSYEKSFIGAYLMVLAQEGADRAMALHVGGASKLAEFNPAEIGRRAAEKAVGLLGGKPVPTQRATVVYSPFAAHSIAETLASALSAESMQRGRSFLQGKIGQTVASDMVTLLDNGRLPGGLGTRPFDDEGVPTGATRLIDEGVLQAVLHDSYTAARDGTASSTGNASRPSHAAPPAVMPSNFYFQPGPQTPDEVIAGVEKGLYVESVMNTHSINPISGDYSVSARGFWIENGKLTHPVNEVTIAIPLQEWLKNVSAVGSDLVFMPMMGAVGSPTIRVDNVMIGGSGEK
jgi:PmbA protein